MANTKKLPLSKAKSQFAKTVDRVRFGDRYILTYHGEERAALISIEDLRAMEALEDALDLKEALRRLAEKGDTPAEDVFKDLGV